MLAGSLKLIGALHNNLKTRALNLITHLHWSVKGAKSDPFLHTKV